MKNKLSLVVLVGGQSTEHEISILSASNVIAALDQNKYNVAACYISREGAWFYIADIPHYLAEGPEACVAKGKAQRVYCALGNKTPTLVAALDPTLSFHVDCFVPILHGTCGEDGTIQGLFELMNVAYVGADVLSSSMSMNKAITKHILATHGIATAKGRLLAAHDPHTGLYAELSAELGPELFVKPVSLGSSVGVSRAKNAEELDRAVQNAFRYDRYVLVEECIVGREIECAVLGNDEPLASLPSEIISHHDFYSYDAKYVDPAGASTEVPAKLPAEISAKIREIAVTAFKAVCCRGMLRVDFFLTPQGRLLVNEVNTIPGFTNISMYPKMWQASGLSYPALLDRLVELALENHQQQKVLLRSVSKGTHVNAVCPPTCPQ